MARIVPKLNLNKNPHTAENYSLVFAKNIRLDANGNIRKDFDIEPIRYIAKEVPVTDQETGTEDVELVVFEDLLEKLKYELDELKESGSGSDDASITYIEYFSNIVDTAIERKNITDKNYSYTIVGTIPDNKAIYIFNRITYSETIEWDDETGEQEDSNIITSDFILKYDEETSSFVPCNCNWTYSGGTIQGKVIRNLRNETVLLIGEYKNNLDSLIPFKFINLNYSSYTDNETLYTQTPEIPITNLKFKGYINYIIPNGTYQFYIRYKIREGFYTKWLPATGKLFAGNHDVFNTSIGTISQVNLHKDSNESFEFEVEHLFENKLPYYESFQIGYILSHDDAIVARSWKHFDINVRYISFIYDPKDIEELEVEDLIEHVYGINNVKNLAIFKNNLFVANYIESNRNEELTQYAKNVNVELAYSDDINGSGSSEITYKDQPVNIQTIGNGIYVTSLPVYNERMHQYDNASIKDTDNVIKDGIISNLLMLVQSSLVTSLDGIDTDHGGVTAYYPNENNSSIKIKVLTNNDAAKRKKEEELRKQYASFRQATFNRGTPTIINTSINGIVINDRNIDSLIYTLSNPNSTNAITYVNPYNNKLLTANFVDATVCILEVTLEGTVHYGVVNRGDRGGTDGRHMDDPVIPDETPATDTFIWTSRTVITFSLTDEFKGLIKTDSVVHYTTLVPFQNYSFYIHYVKNNGEETNGYKIGEITKETNGYRAKANTVLYPVISNVVMPPGYVAYFISMRRTGNTTATIANTSGGGWAYHKQIAPTGDSGFLETYSVIEGSAPDINLGLYPLTKNIPVFAKQNNGNNQLIDVELVGSYRSSNDTELLRDIPYFYNDDKFNYRFFGADGVVILIPKDLPDSDDPNSVVPSYKNLIDNEDLLYAVQEYEDADSIDSILYKITPYIKGSNTQYNEYRYLDLNGYICNCYFLDKYRTLHYYTDGSTLLKKYQIDNSRAYDDEDDLQISGNFKEITKYTDDNNNWSDFSPVSSNAFYIYSNYNLNYLTLTDDFKLKFLTLYDGNESQTQHSVERSDVFKLYPSLELDLLYKLPSMYSNMTSKSYSVVNKNDLFIFNNTIRRAAVNDDEHSYDSIYFKALDYYNTPVDKGHIVNLVSIGDRILVHTRDSLFAFSGTQILQANSGDVMTKESDVFDTGISELFGGVFGYGGLQNKYHSLLTNNGYIFFDKDNNKLYYYAGNNELTCISDSIEQIFRVKPIQDIYFADDMTNNRFFICIFYTDKDFITLSFADLKQIKGFISTHDFSFINSVSTKDKCYFLNNNVIGDVSLVADDIYEVTHKTKGCYIGLTNYSSLLPEIHKTMLYDGNQSNNTSFGPPAVIYKPQVNYNSSIIDIICNDSYGTIKTLNYVEWVAKNWNTIYNTAKNGAKLTDNDIRSILMTEPASYQGINVQPEYIRVYTDSTCSDIVRCLKTSNESNLKGVYSNSNPVVTANNESYKYPRYNLGKWTFNYFRNILNNEAYDSEHNYNYEEKGAYVRSNPRSDNSSLILGKYFVIRFVFSNDDFSIESVNFFYNNIL